jgi:hypothetical protein
MTTLQWFKDVPAHLILCVMFLALLLAYYIRPDPVTQDALKAVLGALLLSLQSQKPQPQPLPSMSVQTDPPKATVTPAPEQPEK